MSLTGPDGGYRYRERPVPWLWLGCCLVVLVVLVGVGLAAWPSTATLDVGVGVAAAAGAGAAVSAARREILVTADTVQGAGLRVARDSIEGLAQPKPGERGLRLARVDGSTLTIATAHPEALKRALDLSDDMPAIRLADPDEYPKLFDIERRADVLFTAAGIGPLPDPATSHELIEEARAVFVAGRPAVGFARVDVVDGCAHLEQLSVLPSQMRRGIGTALLEACCEWALDQGYAAMTLTTFADVEWNGPFYARRHFVVTEQLGPELAELYDWENDLGLGRIGTRVVMRRDLVRRALADLTA